MEPKSFEARPLTPSQLGLFRLNVEAVCAMMRTADLLALADHLHDIIRERRDGGRPDRQAEGAFQ